MTRCAAVMLAVTLTALATGGCAVETLHPASVPRAFPPQLIGTGRAAPRRGDVSPVLISERTPVTMNSPGWRLLARGAFSPAVDAFAVEAVHNPDSGLPRIGHALAAGSSGSLGLAVRSMRGALDVEPGSIHEVARAAWLRPRLADLATRFEAGSIWVPPQCRAFMLATLNLLMDNHDDARTWVAQAIQLGDRTTSTRALEAEIGRAAELAAPEPVPDHTAVAATAAPLGEVLRDLDDLTNAALGLQRSLLESMERYTDH